MPASAERGPAQEVRVGELGVECGRLVQQLGRDVGVATPVRA
jgi:hypothetical protein